MNNPLKYYFSKIRNEQNLNSYKEIASKLNITYGIVNNAYSGRTLNPSRKLAKTLSEINHKPAEVILSEIYKNSFLEGTPEYVKIVSLSLHYYFGYRIFYDNNNYIQSSIPRWPLTDKKAIISTIQRREKSELKFTATMDWESLRDSICKSIDINYEYDANHKPCAPFQNWENFLQGIISYTFALFSQDKLSSFKRVYIIFPLKEKFAYQILREQTFKTNFQIVPLLYDSNAKYSIHDIDQI